MQGSFGTRMQKRGDEYQFLLITEVIPPTGYVNAKDQVWQ